MAILYRLKTGCQWRELSMKQFLRENTNGKVFIKSHFQKWNKNVSWEKVWQTIVTIIKYPEAG